MGRLAAPRTPEKAGCPKRDLRHTRGTRDDANGAAARAARDMSGARVSKMCDRCANRNNCRKQQLRAWLCAAGVARGGEHVVGWEQRMS